MMWPDPYRQRLETSPAAPKRLRPNTDQTDTIITNSNITKTVGFAGAASSVSPSSDVSPSSTHKIVPPPPHAAGSGNDVGGNLSEVKGITGELFDIVTKRDKMGFQLARYFAKMDRQTSTLQRVSIHHMTQSVIWANLQFAEDQTLLSCPTRRVEICFAVSFVGDFTTALRTMLIISAGEDFVLESMFDEMEVFAAELKSVSLD
jgi:hypothetical protein